MGIVADVGNDEGVVGQSVVLDVARKLREGDDVLFLCGAIEHIAEVNERVVVLDVQSGVVAGVSGVGEAFGVGLPSLSGRGKVAHKIVSGDGPGVSVIVGQDLAGGQHHVVADGRMGVGVI